MKQTETKQALKQQERKVLKRQRTLTWIATVIVAMVLAALGIRYSAPAPPARIVLATGYREGAYYTFGHRYAEMLRESGLHVTVRETGGSLNNVNLLLSGEADVAFVQGGVLPAAEMPVRETLGLSPTAFSTQTGHPWGKTVGERLAVIASVYYEPLWVFYRGAEIDLLSKLKGRRISVGGEGSGTLALSSALLQRNGVNRTNSTFIMNSTADAITGLLKGVVDAAMFVTTCRSEIVRTLIGAPDIRLMNFRRHLAYLSAEPYLGRVDLAEGELDLARNLPARNVSLLAPTAMLACRADLHPTVVYKMLMTARKIHGSGNLLHEKGQFPTDQYADLPLHSAAQTFFTKGMPDMMRILPFWLVRLIAKAKFLLLPLVTLMIPFFKVGGLLWRVRIIWLIRRHYDVLREIEDDYEDVDDAPSLMEALEKLENLKNEMAKSSRGVPASYRDRIYHWRLHIAMIRDEFRERLAEAGGNE